MKHVIKETVCFFSHSLFSFRFLNVHGFQNVNTALFLCVCVCVRFLKREETPRATNSMKWRIYTYERMQKLIFFYFQSGSGAIFFVVSENPSAERTSANEQASERAQHVL